jgi:predicted XRE-type DNA-binding protein
MESAQMSLSCLNDTATENQKNTNDKLRVKTGLANEIKLAMKTLGLTQQAAAKRMGIPQPKVSGMMRGDFTNLSESKLMDCLNRLGYDIEIKVRPATELIGHLTLAKT